MAIVFVSEYSYRKAVKDLDDLGTMNQARMSILRVERGLLNAESGQRGYLLTGRQEYLEPYEKAGKAIKEELHHLEQYFEDAPETRQLLGKLDQLAESKFSEITLAIRLYGEGKAGAATELVLSGIGREQMIDTLAVSDELLRHASFRIAEGRKNVYTTLWISRIVLVSLCALGILAIFMYLRQSLTLLQQQLERQNLVQSERDRLELEVTRRTTTLTKLTHHLQAAREDERKRLARDLHDELGALLTSAKLDVARIKPRLAGTEPADLGLLTHLIDTLNSCVALKRRIIEGLHPSSLSHLGLVATLEILAREFAEQTGIAVHHDLAPVKLESTSELVIYRVVQEALTNITKYAQARNVWITLGAQDGQVHLSVRDDGIGFDTATQPSSAHGLTGMRFRVEAEGGSLVVESTLGKGTSIQVTLPESTNAAPQE